MIKDFNRFKAGFVLIGISAAIFIFFISKIGWDNFFNYNYFDNNWGQWPKVIWILIWAMVGWATAAFIASSDKNAGLKDFLVKYLLIYPISIGIITIIISWIMFRIEPFDNNLFYITSTFASLFLGYRIDFLDLFIAKIK